MRRLYESTFIVNAALEDMDIEAVITKVTSYIENQGGEIKTVDRWGRRRLAYPINKKFNGFYVHIEFDSAPNAVPVIERFYVLEDTILRHLTLVLPEELKELRAKKALERGITAVTPFDEDKKDNKKEDKKEDKKEEENTEDKKEAPEDKAPVEETPTEEKEEPKEAEVAEESQTEEN